MPSETGSLKKRTSTKPIHESFEDSILTALSFENGPGLTSHGSHTVMPGFRFMASSSTVCPLNRVCKSHGTQTIMKILSNFSGVRSRANASNDTRLTQPSSETKGPRGNRTPRRPLCWLLERDERRQADLALPQQSPAGLRAHSCTFLTASGLAPVSVTSPPLSVILNDADTPSIVNGQSGQSPPFSCVVRCSLMCATASSVLPTSVTTAPSLVIFELLVTFLERLQCEPLSASSWAAATWPPWLQ